MYLPITGTGDGSAPVVPITFEYLAQDHVKATVDGSPVGITWTGASEVTFDAAVAAAAEWKVYRETPTSEPLVDFTDGSFLTEDDLDTSQRQLLFRQQEVDVAVNENVTAAVEAAEAAAQAEIALLTPQVEADAEAAALAAIATKADIAGADFEGRVTVPASVAGGTFFNLGYGTTPDVPNRLNGDIWITTTGGLFFQALGVTLQVASTGTSGLTNYTTTANLAASGGSAGIGFTIGATGAVARTVQARLREAFYAADFGLTGTGDEGVKLTAFFNSVNSNPGIPHYLDDVEYETSVVLPAITASNAWIEGKGAEARDGLGGEKSGTWITYTGPVTLDPVVTISSVSGASNRRTSNVKFLGIGIDAAELAAAALEMNSLFNSEIDALPIRGTTSGVEAGVVASLAESRTSQLNRVRLKLRQTGGASASGAGIHFTGDATANWSLNHFWVDAIHEDNAVIIAENVDNNDWWSFRSFVVPGGAAVESASLLGGASEPVSARAERFHYYSANLPAQVYGTATHTYPATNIRFHLDSDNGTPEPLIGTGASAHFTKNSSATVEAPWVSYTPIVVPIAGTVTSWSAVTGRYRKIGKMVDVKITFSVVTNGTGDIGFTASLPMVAGGAIANILVGKESAVNNKAIVGLVNSGSSSLSIYNFDGTYPGISGGTFTLSGSYEVA
jgi:hypothetical protein